MTTHPRLYLITPMIADSALFRDILQAALSAGPVDCVQLQLAATDPHIAQRHVETLAPLIQEKGAAVLIVPPADFREVARWGVDGVHVSQPQAMTDALAALKPERIVGAGGLKTKDAAMTAGEAGCDYVMFGEPRPDGSVPSLEQVVERCQWWAEVFTTPSVGYAATLESVAPIAATGVEFVALGPWACDGSLKDIALRFGQAAAQLKA